MTDLRTAAQMALDALEQVQEADTAGATPKMVMEARKLYEPTITALRAALAQPEQEDLAQLEQAMIEAWKPIPQREWQGLTDEEIFEAENSVPDEVIADRDWCVYFARAIEAKLKEKNI